MDLSSEAIDLKQLIEIGKEQAFHPRQLPAEDPVDQEAVDTMRERIELAERLETYGRAKDIYQDFSPDAAKRLVMESHFAKNSSDRIKAADKILDRAEGKPVNRNINANITGSNPNDFTEQELDTRNKQLMGELGYIEGVNAKRLIQSTGNERTVIPVTPGPEVDEGEGPPEEPQT